MRVGSLVLIAMLISLFTLTPSIATISYTTCENTTMSTHFSYIVNDTGNEVNKTSQTLCPFGCNANSGLCNPDPYSSDATASFYFIFPLVAFVLIYFASTLDKADWMIHILLIASSILLLVVPFGILSDAINASFGYPYVLMWFVFFIVLFYYIIKVIITAFKASGVKT